MLATRIIVAAIAAVALFAQPAIARPTAASDQLSPAEIRLLKDILQKAPAATQQPPAPAPIIEALPPPPAPVVAPAAAPPAAPPVTQNTVTTTGPVSSETTISLGTLAGQVLTWAAAAFGSLAATVFTAWGVRLFKLAGVQMTDAARARLQEIIVNGLNVGAAQATKDIAGKGQVQIKNETVAAAVAYAQVHGADAIKQLGLDPQSGAAVEAIKARIETAIADPMAPTPAVLDPSKPTPAPQPG